MRVRCPLQFIAHRHAFELLELFELFELLEEVESFEEFEELLDTFELLEAFELLELFEVTEFWLADALLEDVDEVPEEALLEVFDVDSDDTELEPAFDALSCPALSESPESV